MKKAVFLDRDGTIIIDKNYLQKLEDIEYFPDTFSALSLMQKKGYDLFIITNQSGIGRSLFPESVVDQIHQKIQKDMVLEGLLPFKDILYCPHAPSDHCSCRKPHPEMIEKMVKKWQINRSLSYMIGDKLIDAECGKNAQINGVLLNLTDPLYKTYPNLLSFAKSLS